MRLSMGLLPVCPPGLPGLRPPSATFDTRIDSDGVAKTPIQDAKFIKVKVGGVDGVPADATAVPLNLTAVGATAPTYLTAWPDGTTRPNTSNLNPKNAAAATNFDMVSIGADGYIDLYNAAGSVNALADIAGYYH